MRVLAFITFLTLLTACKTSVPSIPDGDGQNPPPPPDNAVLTGRLEGLVIEGLPYTTETQNGTTSADGGFTYKAGETVRFYLGGTVLATVAATKIIPYRSLVSGAELPSLEADIENAVASNKATPFLRIFNITRLLISMDEDQKPSNGIFIAESTRQAFDDVKLNFDQRTTWFANSCAGTLKSTDKLMFTTGYAAKYLYLATKTPITTNDVRGGGLLARHLRIDTDSDGNGEVNYFKLFEYDEEGNLTGQYSKTPDGNTYHSRERTYDIAGRQISVRESDLYTSGSAHTYSYDRVGNLVSSHFTSGPSLYKYTYDAHGNNIGYSADLGADGSIDNYGVSTFNDNGDQLTQRAFTAQSQLSYSYSAEYDSENRLTSEIEDYEADGDADFIHLYTYTETGQIESETYDFDGSGQFRTTSRYEYDDKGNVVTTEWLDATGNIDAITTSIYDANNRMVTALTDEDNDGDTDSVWHYAYDAAGNKTRELHDADYGHSGRNKDLDLQCRRQRDALHGRQRWQWCCR